MFTVPLFRLRAASNPLVRQVGIAYVDAAERHGLGPGVVFRVVLRCPVLTPGFHGFHVHENPSLLPSVKKHKLVTGGAAGAHYDPKHTDSHQGPYGHGHLGDLPKLHAVPGGAIDDMVVAPRLRISDCIGRALIIHSGGDNYTDDPPNGGGKSRVIGGIIV